MEEGPAAAATRCPAPYYFAVTRACATMSVAGRTSDLYPALQSAASAGAHCGRSVSPVARSAPRTALATLAVPSGEKSGASPLRTYLRKGPEVPRNLVRLFEDQRLVAKVERRLPHLFHYAERDSSRAGRVGMEVGSLRERILVSLLIHKFGRTNVETDLPITQHEVDVRVYGEPISIKSITTRSTRIAGVKAIWTMDTSQGEAFVQAFQPTCDYLLAHIVWGDTGGLYYVPFETQARVLEELGRPIYFQIPRPGTNERGVQVSAQAMSRLIKDSESRRITIQWQRPEGEYDQYERWVEYWRLD